MLVAEKNMLHIKVASIKSMFRIMKAEMKQFKNCANVLSESGTGCKKELRGSKLFFSLLLPTNNPQLLIKKEH